MKILVTGGAGFIGSHLTDRLIKEGHQAMVLDNFSTGSKKFVNPKAKVARVDVRDAKKVDSAFKKFKPRIVFHLAAMIDVRESLRNPTKDYEVNIAGAVNILEACKNHKVKKFIFASSAAVYGDNKNLPLPETEAPTPISPYGASKAAVEQFGHAYQDLYNFDVICLRYPNVYGPRQGTVGEGGVIAVFCKNLAKDKGLNIFGQGRQTRDFIFVDDIVEANIRALKSKKKFMVINASTNKKTSISSLAKELLTISGKNAKIKHLKAIKGEVLHSCLDNRLIKKELNWKPGASLPEGLKKTWEWFSK